MADTLTDEEWDAWEQAYREPRTSWSEVRWARIEHKCHGCGRYFESEDYTREAFFTSNEHKRQPTIQKWCRDCRRIK